MARYIDAETALKIIDNYAKTVTADGIVVVKAIRDIVEIITPTADVVPKSEVESIITLNSQLEAEVVEQRKEIERLTINMNAYGLAVKRLAEERAEIFAEIERLMLDGAIGGKYPAKVINPDKYAELKKKYTEGEQ